MKIALVSCTKLKASHSCNARMMYQPSTLFKKAVHFIEQNNYKEWFILSGKHGLLKQHDVIEPYDVTLNHMKASERKTWAQSVLKQLASLDLNITQIDFYAGVTYREYLTRDLEQKGIKCNIPLKGKGIGEQLQYFSYHTK
ncbi:DUF6884 domain-containing protein [Alkalihalobacillus sp. TS-13]|uniref:DUF6884 domain-containing protein n=1 Tax=Alkalihalobacillus sp. TS-13 TaxID=2842455 RepID=UPI001C880955|nr:DUF6884 domain-containing protein [Alkalihalobacillus sp. TS-13]